MNIRTEGTSLIKVLTAIASSFGVVWFFVEPVVEDYVHEQIEIVHKEDMKEIEKLKTIVDEDHSHSIEKRNQIIREFQHFHRRTTLKTE